MSKQTASRQIPRVPQIMQMEATECGAASLAMVLASYGKWVSLEQARIACGVSRDGTKASNILRAAKTFGLEAKGFRITADALYEETSFPCIVFLDRCHFAVLRGFKKDKAYLNDPDRGSVVIPLEEFEQRFSEICLQFSVGPDFEKGGKRRSVFQFGVSRLQGFLSGQAFIICASLMVSLLGILAPVFSQVFLDEVLGTQTTDWLYPLMSVMAGVALLQLVVNWLRGVQLLRTNAAMAITFSTTFMWHLLRLPVGFYAQRLVGDVAARQKDNQALATSIASLVSTVVLGATLMVVYLVAMLVYSIPLALVGVAAIILNLLATNYLAQKRINMTRVMLRDQGLLSGSTITGIGMIETIKSSGSENAFFTQWAGMQAKVNNQTVKINSATATLGIIPNLTILLANATILIAGVWLVLEGNFTLGALMAFQGLMSGFITPAQQFAAALQSLQEVRTRMERVEDVLHYPVDVGEDSSEHTADIDARSGSYDKLSGAFTLDKVTFGYSPLEPALLNDFSLDVKQGQSIALVGASGCGKTTVAKMLTGLYRPWSGEVRFDGTLIEDIDRDVLYASVASVDQDIMLFEDTIANNIRMWDDSIEDFEIIMAARDAALHDDIVKREGGYKNCLTEGGKNLSGGQRQRMEIARVLAQDPRLIVLDEATSALDGETERRVMAAIRRRHITTVIIAHRLSTVRDCDLIVVIEKGRAVEQGTHEELLALQGVYAKLVSSR